MKITINVSPPIYDSLKGITSIRLETNYGNHANVNIGFDKIISCANIVSKEVVDFFILSASVYGIDRFIERRKNSVDGWSRELKVTFPVVNPVKWQLVKIKIDSLLSFLTGDYWDVDFYQAQFEFPEKPLDVELSNTFSQVNLFSGGLDSLIGALDFLNNNSGKLLLVSQYDPHMRGPLQDQLGLKLLLQEKYPDRLTFVPSVKVTLDTLEIKETTFRARSILFIGLALVVAKAKDLKIIVPENGTVSLNYPLSASRRSACSTRTTHPYFIQLIRNIWDALGIVNTIENPYEPHTKGEMVLNYRNDAFAKSLFLRSNSCGKRRRDERRGNPDAKHCGVCMPCIYRRAALSLIDMDRSEDYADLINSLEFKNQKGQDVGACLEYLKKTISLKDIKDELIINGVKDLNKVELYANVVWRTRNELKEWIKKVGNSAVKSKANIQ